MYSDDHQIFNVAQLYYLENLSQADIAEKLSLSRPKVSRLLARAREDGIVSIRINAPPSCNANALEAQIKAKFSLENVLVVPSVGEDVASNLLHTVKEAAPYFQSFIQDGDRIGIAWGYTLLKLAESLRAASLQQSAILQVTGNLDNADSHNFASEIVRHFSQRLGVGALNTLPCPVIVENSIIVDLLLHDSKISNIMSQVNEVDVVFPNIGVLSDENCLSRTGYISGDELTKLHKSGSVGCVCCRFIDSDGNIVDSALDERTISISIDALKNARHSCALVCSENKLLPLLGCLRAGIINVLAIDSLTAERLLSYSDI